MVTFENNLMSIKDMEKYIKMAKRQNATHISIERDKIVIGRYGEFGFSTWILEEGYDKI